ncbi:MAG: hypothetical protein KG075_17545 [Alphaproteobacteria bacterium]|nr:hypothetical protein [Alphaproteobacteria bacterium]
MGTMGEIGWGGNGGFHACNIAAQFGPPRRIILVGFDMRTDKGVHWHGRHANGLSNPHESTTSKWAQTFDEIAPEFTALGIEVLNASPISKIRAYPKMSLEGALNADAARIAGRPGGIAAALQAAPSH